MRFRMLLTIACFLIAVIFAVTVNPLDSAEPKSETAISDGTSRSGLQPTNPEVPEVVATKSAPGSSNDKAAGQPREPFPIGFWYGPPPAANTMETWRRVAEAHFNLVGPCSGYSLTDNQKMLQLCAQVKLKALVVDHRVRPEMVAGKEWRKIVRHVVDDYQKYPALYGYFLHDEPSSRWFPVLGELHAEFQQCDPGHIPYINLLPNYATPRNLGAPSYREYLRRYVETVRPSVISYDHYPLLDDGSDRHDYFENLEAVRTVASDNNRNLSTWGIILIAPHVPYRDPTAAELQWQAYTSLVYGVKGLLYFTYWPPESLAVSAIVDTKGKPTERYEMVQELNRKITAIGPTLLSLRSTGVYHTGSIPVGCTRLPSESIIRVPADKPLIVGCFEDPAGNEFVMLVNRDYRQPQDFEVELRADVVSISGFDAVEGQSTAVAVEKRRFSLSLESGEGRLFAIKSQFDGRGAFRPSSEIKFEFDEDEEDWLAEHSLSPPVLEKGVLRSSITGTDPYFSRTFLSIPADCYRRLAVRMKTPGRTAQLYWQTADDTRFDGARSVGFETIGDNNFHEYVIPLRQHPGWKNQEIRAIRLDPVTEDSTLNQTVEIDYIRGE